MGPPAKKRKEPPQKCTLLDFFPNADAIKRAREASREIIVIDSDGDGGVLGEENGKRSARMNSRTGVSEDSQSLNSATSTPAHREDKDTFGMPSELLRPINPHMEASRDRFYAHHHSPIAPQPDHSESMFGVSAPLLEPTSVRNQQTETNQTDLVAHDNMSTMPGGNSVNAAEFLIGEWALRDDERDDELVALEVLDNGAKTDEGEGDPSDEQNFCPVCNVDLTGILARDAQTHVNQCLDTTLQNDSFVIQESTSIAVSIEPGVTSDNSSPSTLVRGKGGDLYTVLMNSHKENEIWVEADAAAELDFRPTRRNCRRAPFYKILQGMPIAVDAFCYVHATVPTSTLTGLPTVMRIPITTPTSDPNGRVVLFIVQETANLIIHMLAVDPGWIHPLPLDTPTIIPNTGGVSVTLIEANHCPGSCLFFFEGQQTINAGDSAFKSPFTGSPRIFRYLHCGDFRASPRHVIHPAVKGNHIDHIYLDTTYLDPKYMFPPQPLVISACAELARRLVVGGGSRNPTIDAWMKSPTSAETGGQERLQERILVIVGTYSIGKERIVKAIAQALGAKIYCDMRKIAILQCQADKELHDLLTTDPAKANVHILPLGTVTSDNLRSYLQRFKGTFSRVIGFRPTGWTYSPPSGGDLNGSIQSIISRGESQHFSYTDLQPSQKSSHNIQIFGVPYSEHSSFFELTCFAMSCNWGRMIPTVNVGNPTSRAKMIKWLKRWELEKRSTKPCIIQPKTADYW